MTYLSIVLSPRWPFLRSRSSEVTRSNCRFRSFGVVIHVYGSVFRLEREKWPYSIVCCIEIGIKWKYGNASYYVQMPWKVAIFHIQSAIKTTFMKGITWNLVHTFFRVSSSTYIPVFWKFWNFGGFFEKIKKNVEKNLKISEIFKISKIRDSSFVVYSFLHRLAFSDCLHL